MPRFYSPRDFPETGFGSATKGFLGGLQLGQELRLNEQRDRRREELAQAQIQRWEGEYARASAKSEVLKAEAIQRAMDDEGKRGALMDAINREQEMSPDQMEVQRLQERTAQMKDPKAIEYVWKQFQESKSQQVMQEAMQASIQSLDEAAADGVFGEGNEQEVEAMKAGVMDGSMHPDEVARMVMGKREEMASQMVHEQKWQDAEQNLTQIIEMIPEGPLRDQVMTQVALYQQPSMRAKADPQQVVQEVQEVALQGNEIQGPGPQPIPMAPPGMAGPQPIPSPDSGADYKPKPMKGKKSLPKLKAGSPEAFALKSELERLASTGGVREQYSTVIAKSGYSPDDPEIQKIIDGIIDAYAGTNQ